MACWKKISGLGEFLDLLVTSNERHNLVVRAAAIERIISGEKYSQIAKELWLSSQTISSIKKALRERSYKSYRERGKSERKTRIYSRDITKKERKSRGRSVRTKYGTIHMP
ncbi:MAG: hypothetical protein A2122_00325 [Candidatus Liptonbacteria bacterium GWB1_49_6]|uniref:HTH luxR-type domain-containing protein n=1 Tax=Candidatus Liptonbacteria bacterium GWB1_49_6 TaxID=1798644 RepID=A0A1G2C5P0_9BACT|nr:MAG: hypothetical protein A2122_00325 [Candidatus Liptonbacteria bacterium GWB1_49_6]